MPTIPPHNQAATDCDIAVIGAGAAGLFAAIWAGRTAQAHNKPLRVIALDGAKKLGAKVLVAGGGRCNVTHHSVDHLAYAGASPNAIKKVLRSFDVPQTIAFFADLGVTLKREDTGKLFPTTDDAHTVLDALLAAAHAANVQLLHPWRVGHIQTPTDAQPHFTITRAVTDAPAPGEPTHRQPPPPLSTNTIRAHRIILATGGMALPRSGSDGLGYSFARDLGHTLTPRVVPALVPIVLDPCFVQTLSGLAVPAALDVRAATGKRLHRTLGSTLCTHFGLSGPGPLDVSRHYFDARAHDQDAALILNWAPALDPEALDALLLAARHATPLRTLTGPPMSLPERLARALIITADIDPTRPMTDLPRERRRALAHAVCACQVPVSGQRGFTYAEVTAGGVPLTELHLDSMTSRTNPHLHLCGEILDVDGRIGGFNFQWAWASGYIAGTAAAKSLR